MARAEHRMFVAPGAGRVCGVPAVVGEVASISWALLEGRVGEMSCTHSLQRDGVEAGGFIG